MKERSKELRTLVHKTIIMELVQDTMTLIIFQRINKINRTLIMVMEAIKRVILMLRLIGIRKRMKIVK